MPDPKYPPIRRAGYDDAARAAIDHPDDAAHPQILHEATRLDPLKRVQSRLDQVAGTLEDYARPGPKSLPGNVRDYIKGELSYIARDVATLKAAAAAAEHMHDHYSDQFRAWEAAMDQPKEDDAPQLTTTGEPHPLQEGGYDPAKDPALPGNISDVEALKEGKTTRAQAEAIAKADTAAGAGGASGEGLSPSPEAGAVVTPGEGDEPGKAAQAQAPSKDAGNKPAASPGLFSNPPRDAGKSKGK